MAQNHLIAPHGKPDSLSPSLERQPPDVPSSGGSEDERPRIQRDTLRRSAPGHARFDFSRSDDGRDVGTESVQHLRGSCPAPHEYCVRERGRGRVGVEAEETFSSNDTGAIVSFEEEIPIVPPDGYHDLFGCDPQGRARAVYRDERERVGATTVRRGEKDSRRIGERLGPGRHVGDRAAVDEIPRAGIPLERTCDLATRGSRPYDYHVALDDRAHREAGRTGGRGPGTVPCEASYDPLVQWSSPTRPSEPTEGVHASRENVVDYS